MTMDVLEAVRKSMRANRSKDTQPELKLRRALWAAGMRGYRKNVKTLPGKPDVAFTRYKVAVFLHGCFWHGCPACESRKNLHPTQNAAFWSEKVRRNKERDVATQAALSEAGWTVLVFWEHEMRESAAAVAEAIGAVLAQRGRPA
jgi:DNA mismatch endonuclease, patch repair protein